MGEQALAQNVDAAKQPPDTWVWPLLIANGFSANFGEYRSNHFHAGLDLRTFQRNGFPVYAVADGMVEVIRKDRRGTGLGIVIRHDNGYYSFSYHLEALRDDLQKLLDARLQEGGNPYPGNIELRQGVRLKAGEHFAFSGESGSGFSHLHVEIRNAQGLSVNPLSLLTSPLADLRPPIVKSLLIRARASSLINHEKREWLTHFKNDGQGEYGISDTLCLDGTSDWVVIGEDISDTGRPVVPYIIRFFLDEQMLFSQQFKELSHEQNRQLGLVYDRQYTGMGSYAFNLFCQPENTLHSTSSQAFEEAWTGIGNGQHLAMIEMLDIEGNLCRARIPFYYLPHQAVQISPEAEPGLTYLMKGPSQIGPVTLNIRALDHAGRTLYTGKLPISDLGSANRFSLTELKREPAALVFALQKDGLTIWQNIKLLNDQVVKAPAVSALWQINRDTVSLFYADSLAQIPPLKIDGQICEPLASRPTLKGLYQIYSISKGGALDGLQSFLLALHPGQKSRWQGDGYTIEIPETSVNLPRVLKIDTKVAVGDCDYPLLSRPLALSPAHLPFLKPIRVGFNLPRQTQPEQLGLFTKSQNGRTWNHIATKYDGAGEFSAALSAAGVSVALLRDIFPPTIGKGYLAKGLAEKKFFIRVFDKGKGIDYQTVSARIGERILPSEYDPDWNRLEVTLEGLASGKHTLTVQLSDYAGHRVSKSFQIYIK